MNATLQGDPNLHRAIEACVTALRHVADYRLSSGLNNRLLELGERKATLSPEEHEELQSLVAFTQQRTIEKLEAELALDRLRQVFPEAIVSP